MGFWNIAKEIGKEMIEMQVETIEHNKNEYNKTSEWAADRDDETLKRYFKHSSGMTKKAVYDELKRRGY